MQNGSGYNTGKKRKVIAADWHWTTQHHDSPGHSDDPKTPGSNYRTNRAATNRPIANNPVECSWTKAAALAVVEGVLLEPDATESTDDGKDDDDADGVDEDEADDVDDDEASSVAFLVPHWLSFLHWSWPSASLG